MTKSEYFTLFALLFLVLALLILAITIPNHARELKMINEAAAVSGDGIVEAPKWIGTPATLLYISSGSLILLSSIFIVVSIKSKDR